jgi:uncharacterized protein (TIGR03118 family)
MLNRSNRKLFSVLPVLLAICFPILVTSFAAAQYAPIYLVANRVGATPFSFRRDPNLVNGWGLAFFPGSPFWVSDAGTGVATLYGRLGRIRPLVVTIPAAAGGFFHGPTGIVANSTSDFAVQEGGNSGTALFIFATLDGTISGWNFGVDVTHAIIAVDYSAQHTAYTGLAIASTSSGNFIYAADAFHNRIDMFDGTFHLVNSFTDPSIPSGFTAYGIQTIGGNLYVTFASTTGKPGGFVDIFDTSGNLIKTFAQGGTLNGPWGIALAPANFGQFSNDLLVGNNTDGRINAFDPSTGEFKGQLQNIRGEPVSISGLWALAFGGGSPANGNTNQLFFTGGPNGFADGSFGMIIAINP